MKVIVVNNSLDTFTYSVATVGPETSVEIDSSSWFNLYKDTTFICDIRKNNVYINDGSKDYHFEDAEDFLEEMVNLCTSRDADGNRLVTTEYEKNDKLLKLARVYGLVDAATSKAVMSIKIPGVFNSTDGRYVAGGYAMTDDFRTDDYVIVYVEDTDRLMAAAYGGLTDVEMQANGYPDYPVVKTYTDTDVPAENQGWYFWPIAQGGSLPPMGECEVEPIGGYGFVPAGLYLKLEYIRTVTTGGCRVNFFWGKKE